MAVGVKPPIVVSFGSGVTIRPPEVWAGWVTKPSVTVISVCGPRARGPGAHLDPAACRCPARSSA